MIEDLRTDYKSDILMPVQQNKRTFNIVDSENNILFENVHIEDNSQYLQVGDEYGSDIINEQNTAINALARGTGLTFDTYQDYLDARAQGEVPVGSIIYILEGNQTVITADQVTYNDSNVKLALDALVSNLGSKSSASAVTGNDAFSKINTLNTILNVSYPKVFTVAGQIANAANDGFKGHGVATVFLFSRGLAQINYQYTVSTAGGSGSTSNYNWGLNANLLHNLNSNIPTITAINAGTCTWYLPHDSNDIWSKIDGTHNGYGCTHERTGAQNQFWNPSRNYNGTTTGAFAVSEAKLDARICGICYGTFTP